MLYHGDVKGEMSLNFGSQTIYAVAAVLYCIQLVPTWVLLPSRDPFPQMFGVVGRRSHHTRGRVSLIPPLPVAVLV